ncbi:MAG: TRAP transporter small permease, partial [Flavobacteriaceae bacterium]|nr:TRAP transporter small permease [Flavobacteriaceae bacterium]
IIFFVFCAFILGGLRLVYITYLLGQFSPALQIPLSLVYFVVPVSGLLIIFYKVSDLINYYK